MISANRTAGIPLDSQRAFELASKGMLRPAVTSDPVIYSLKLVEFELPNFEIGKNHLLLIVDMGVGGCAWSDSPSYTFQR